MEPATVLCTGVAAVALGGWCTGRLAALVRSMPDRRTNSALGRLAATTVLAATGFVVIPRPVSADPMPPLVRLTDRVEESSLQAAAPSQETVYEVEPGDSLWRIAAAAIGPTHGTRPSSAEVAGFWPRIYELNRNVIGDDPDLILPGQRLVIPLR